jgi:hypothetical protein
MISLFRVYYLRVRMALVLVNLSDACVTLALIRPPMSISLVLTGCRILLILVASVDGYRNARVPLLAGILVLIALWPAVVNYLFPLPQSYPASPVRQRRLSDRVSPHTGSSEDFVFARPTNNSKLAGLFGGIFCFVG